MYMTNETFAEIANRYKASGRVDDIPLYVNDNGEVLAGIDPSLEIVPKSVLLKGKTLTHNEELRSWLLTIAHTASRYTVKLVDFPGDPAKKQVLACGLTTWRDFVIDQIRAIANGLSDGKNYNLSVAMSTLKYADTIYTTNFMHDVIDAVVNHTTINSICRINRSFYNYQFEPVYKSPVLVELDIKALFGACVVALSHYKVPTVYDTEKELGLGGMADLLESESLRLSALGLNSHALLLNIISSLLHSDPPFTLTKLRYLERALDNAKNLMSSVTVTHISSFVAVYKSHVTK
ncbi:MAG: hypothetical protein ACRDBQ_18950 [Shewanella sp.]